MLAAQDAFKDWAQADADIQALGPGTHGWMAVLKTDGRTVGYMVIHAAEEGGYRLGEYGVGPNALFDPASLKKSLEENGLLGTKGTPYTADKLYFHPFAAVWEVRIGSDLYWLDAKTAELLPFDRSGWEKSRALLSVSKEEPEPFSESVSLHVGKTFDPYDKLPWMTGEPTFDAGNGEKAQTRLRGGLHLRYVSEPYGQDVLYALPVIGFRQGKNGRLDLALDMAGLRFVPFRELARLGRFYA